VRELAVAAAAVDRPLRINVLGYADSSGSSDWNLKLSQARAENVRDVLRAAGIPGVEFEAVHRMPRDLVPEMPDRIIAATALRLGLPLITRDRRIAAAGIKTIW